MKKVLPDVKCMHCGGKGSHMYVTANQGSGALWKDEKIVGLCDLCIDSTKIIDSLSITKHAKTTFKVCAPKEEKGE